MSTWGSYFYFVSKSLKPEIDYIFNENLSDFENTRNYIKDHRNLDQTHVLLPYKIERSNKLW